MAPSIPSSAGRGLVMGSVVCGRERSSLSTTGSHWSRALVSVPSWRFMGTLEGEGLAFTPPYDCDMQDEEVMLRPWLKQSLSLLSVTLSRVAASMVYLSPRSCLIRLLRGI